MLLAKMSGSTSNKQIAKNTILLYIRMVFLLGISFYTTRAVLHALGVVDLGIYNVVGGVVAMFGFINGSLSSASSRFITYALGKGNEEDLKSTFNTIVSIHIIFGLLIFFLAETIGMWFVLNKLVIPDNRVIPALCVYQSAIISSIIVVLSSPFNADIIAHEKMSAFAYISIYEAVAKLIIVFLLYIISWDKLITYAIMLTIVQVSVISFYILYCKNHFEESRFRLYWDSNKVKTIFTYAGWVMTGSFSYICCTQGLNILLNIFFGPTVNAARALANQLQGAVNQFTTNFQTAVKPQILKSYANGNIDRMHSLILASSKFGSFLMLLIIIPVFTCTDFILRIWLENIPDYTISFVQIMLLVGLISAMKDPTMTAIHATGNIKKAEIVEMIIMLSVLPISYFALKFFTINPQTVMLIYLFVEIATQIARVWVIYPAVNLSRLKYFTGVLFPIIITGFISIIAGQYIKTFLSESLKDYILLIIIVESITILSISLFGFNCKERRYIIKKIKYTIKKFLS